MQVFKTAIKPDVYKRQAIPRWLVFKLAATNSVPKKKRRGASILVTWRSRLATSADEDALRLALAQRQLVSCLLYTSRCV